ncbi:MAG: hypothetical protein U0Q22_08100 [Acidimicrobiales bacterium]
MSRDERSAAPAVPAPAWTAVAAGAAVVFVAAWLARGHIHAHVRFSHTEWVSAPSGIAVLAFGALVAALIGRRHAVLGLVGLALASIGLGVLWLLLGDHRFAGPVLISLSRDHGIHLGDALALLPLGAGACLLAGAGRLWAERLI